MKRTKLKDRALPTYSTAEELTNTVTHALGIGLGIAVCILCVLKAGASAVGLMGAWVYGLSMILLYSCSTIYHGLPAGTAKKVFQVLDHCTIYLLIAGTYTPIILMELIPGVPAVGWGLLTVQWGTAALAITLTAIDLKKFRYFSYICYIVLGWALIFVAPAALSVMSRSAFLYILIGGISYTIGAVLFAIGKKRPWFHSVFHIFVILGSLLQFIGIYLYIL